MPGEALNPSVVLSPRLREHPASFFHHTVSLAAYEIFLLPFDIRAISNNSSQAPYTLNQPNAYRGCQSIPRNRGQKHSQSLPGKNNFLLNKTAGGALSH